MDSESMESLIIRHIQAELDGDLEAAVSVYTHDIEHDFVGSPSPSVGRDAAKRAYERLDGALRTEEMTLTRIYHGAAHCVTEHEFTASVKGAFPGVPEGAARIRGRLLHLFEFRDGLISRENVWAGPFAPID